MAAAHQARTSGSGSGATAAPTVAEAGALRQVAAVMPGVVTAVARRTAVRRTRTTMSRTEGRTAAAVAGGAVTGTTRRVALVTGRRTGVTARLRTAGGAAGRRQAGMPRRTSTARGRGAGQRIGATARTTGAACLGCGTADDALACAYLDRLAPPYSSYRSVHCAVSCRPSVHRPPYEEGRERYYEDEPPRVRRAGGVAVRLTIARDCASFLSAAAAVAVCRCTPLSPALPARRPPGRTAGLPRMAARPWLAATGPQRAASRAARHARRAGRWAKARRTARTVSSPCGACGWQQNRGLEGLDEATRRAVAVLASPDKGLAPAPPVRRARGSGAARTARGGAARGPRRDCGGGGVR
jgi:hypothetical protein